MKKILLVIIVMMATPFATMAFAQTAAPVTYTCTLYVMDWSVPKPKSKGVVIIKNIPYDSTSALVQLSAKYYGRVVIEGHLPEDSKPFDWAGRTMFTFQIYDTNTITPKTPPTYDTTAGSSEAAPNTGLAMALVQPAHITLNLECKKD